jgi:adenylate cyclase
MDRIWQWAWDRYGPRYSWAIYAIGYLVALPVYLTLAFIVVAFEGSDRYLEAALVTAVAVPALVFSMVLPSLGPARRFEQWAAGGEVDQVEALEDTYAWTPGGDRSSGGGPRGVGRPARSRCR